ncbi:MAG: carbohydrate ABC transporter permease, partial [Clostridiales bacterium]|nr:carbohydrate ABC transporter permease [Clostridiales bacterium]
MRRTHPLTVVNHIVVGLMALFCVLPMVLVVMVSLSSDASIKLNGYQLFP